MDKELNKYLIPDLTTIVLDYARDDTYFRQCMDSILGDNRLLERCGNIRPTRSWSLLLVIRLFHWSEKRRELLDSVIDNHGWHKLTSLKHLINNIELINNKNICRI